MVIMAHVVMAHVVMAHGLYIIWAELYLPSDFSFRSFRCSMFFFVFRMNRRNVSHCCWEGKCRATLSDGLFVATFRGHAERLDQIGG